MYKITITIGRKMIAIDNKTIKNTIYITLDYVTLGLLISMSPYYS